MYGQASPAEQVEACKPKSKGKGVNKSSTVKHSAKDQSNLVEEKEA